MTSILGSILTIKSPQATRCFLSSLLRVGRTDELPPLCDSIRCQKFHSQREIRGHEVNQSRIETLSLMFSVKLSGGFLIKLEKFKISNGKLLLRRCNHLPEIHIRVRFKHPIRPTITPSLLIGSILANQLFPCELIAKRNDLELSIEANHHIANKQIIKFNLRVLYLLEEDLVILDIVLNRSGLTISIWLPGTK